MVALIASLALVLYVFLPGVLFRVIFSLFIPLKTFQRTRTDEITFAVLTALIPFLLAIGLVWTFDWPGQHPFYFEDTISQRRADYKMIFAASYSEEFFQQNQPEFWKAFTRTARRQGQMLTWYYLLLLLEALLLGWLSQSYWKFQEKKWYSWLARKLLLPSISGWYVLLTPFAFPETQSQGPG